MLRHRPDSIGITLDRSGWVAVEELLRALAGAGLRLTRLELERVVEADAKQRFALDETGTRIRASQGHSLRVDLGYPPQTPPDVLFHGTPTRNVAAIVQEGLRPAGRHAVHLSADVATASAVGGRRGRHVVLRVDAAALAADGAVFTRSANGVWLVDAVPPRHVSILARAAGGADEAARTAPRDGGPGGAPA